MLKTLKGVLLALAIGLAATTVAAQGTVNVNTADAATLAVSLTGIGEAKAEAIVAYREQNGPFGSLDELTNVKGIGEHTLESNRERMTVGN